MRPSRSRWARTLVAAVSLAWLGAAWSEADAAELFPYLPRLTGELGWGYDSNIYRQTDEGSQGPFLSYYARLRQDVLRLGTGGATFETRAFGQRYLPKFDPADRGTLVVEGNFDHRLFQLGNQPLRGELRGEYLRRQQVFVSRLTGEEYDVDVEDTEVPLGDRFDSGRTSGTLALYYTDPLKTDWGFEYELGVKDYANDYETVPDVQSLDYDQHGWVGWLSRSLARRVRGTVTYESTQRHYDEYLARDLDGELVPDVRRLYHYRYLRAETQADVHRRWRVTMGLEYATRKDEYSGYYDYRAWSLNPEVRTEIGRKVLLWARYRVGFRDYFHAHVSFDPEQPLRRDIWHRAEVEARYQVRTPVALFALVRGDSEDRREPGYSYSRFRSSLGVRLTYDPNH
jgi:hypothetical protein